MKLSKQTILGKIDWYCCVQSERFPEDSIRQTKRQEGFLFMTFNNSSYVNCYIGLIGHWRIDYYHVW